MFKILIGLVLVLSSSINALYSPSDDVVMLSTATFNSRVLQSNDIWLVEFFAPWCGHCKSLAPEWKKAAKALKGIVNLGAVDMDQDQSVGAPYNIKGFPTIKVFGANKNSPSDYNAARTAQAIVDEALKIVSQIVKERMGGGGGGSKSGGSSSGGSGGKSDVVELTESNFDAMVTNSNDLWLVEFFAPWCGHCKSLAPEWEKAATDLKGKVKLGAVDATVHGSLAQKFGVRGYPTIKYFGQNKNDAVDFDGGRTASDIVTWANNKFTENAPAPELKELLSQESVSEACDNQLCFIAFMPNILDCQSKCRNTYLDLIKKVSDKYKRHQWQYLWTESQKHPEVETALSVGGFGYPAMVAVNIRKGKYVLMRGSFSETGLNEFLRDLSMGKGNTSPIEKLPAINKVEAWDKKDGKLPVEEDIDLSDVQMDDLDDKKTEL